MVARRVKLSRFWPLNVCWWAAAKTEDPLGWYTYETKTNPVGRYLFVLRDKMEILPVPAAAQFQKDS
jgi:hypothetical protein